MKISFVGDIFPGDEETTLGFGLKSMYDKRKHFWREDVCELLSDCDFAVGNLESPLLDDAPKPSFYGNPEFADFLKDCGFKALNIANNHILEQGEQGFHSTVDSLRKSGIAVVGATSELDGLPEIVIYEHQGIKIAMAGFCDSSICAIPHISGTYNILNEDIVTETARKMIAADADIRIIIMHWGNEYISYPSFNQRRLAHKLIDMGVNMIVGHHSHCIQPYEQYHGGHILYSLGNFCFDYLQSDLLTRGMIADVEIENRRISDVSLRGVKVYDPVLSHHLVGLISTSDFAEIYKKIDSAYNKRCNLNAGDYINVYQRELRRNRLFQRVEMKTVLLRYLALVPWKVKRQLIKNIIKLYS